VSAAAHEDALSEAAATEIRRVVLVLQSTAMGGMEAHCRDLATEYTRRGIGTSVVLPPERQFDALAASIASGGASLVRMSTDARHGRLRELYDALRFAVCLRRLAPDVVHLHTGGTTGGLAVVLLARLLSGATIVITEHDVPTPQHSGRRDRLTKRLMDGVCHAVISVSRKQAAIRHSVLGSNSRKLLTVLNGVPQPESSANDAVANRARVRAALALSPEALVAGSVVRLDEGKGLDTLLASFAAVRQRIDCYLLLVGDGPLRGELETQAERLGVRQHVIFAGHQTEPLPFFDALDLFVLAVPSGSMSIALLEAMARGVASVITFGGPEEAVVDGVTGLLAPPSSVEGLADVLATALRDTELRRRLGNAGRDYVRRKFSVERVADDLLTVYAAARRGEVPDRYLALAGASRGEPDQNEIRAQGGAGASRWPPQRRGLR
jgi:glycosyltransferase involved in cell wall biosynthesis